MRTRSISARLARYGIPAVIAIVLIVGLRLYNYTYFWLDDFNNVYWVRREGFWKIVGHLINPSSMFFRPLGMLVYWIVFRLAALNSVPYHLLSWLLHAVNTALLFVFLRQATKSQYAAGFAVLFFAFRANFADIYWSFANIFQLLAFGLVMIGLLVYARSGYSFKETLALTAILVLAIRAEEQGVLLPILWFAYELLIRRNFNWRNLWLRYAVFAIVIAWFGWLKITTMHDTDPTRPYYMDLSVITFGRGYGWYFNSLYQTQLRWGAWFIISALLAIAFAIRKNGWALFFLIYTYVTLAPYVFLVNHRFELYSYMAFAGIAGLLALGIRAVQHRITRLVPAPAAAAVLSLVFVVVAVRHFRHEEHRGRDGRGDIKSILDDYRVFLRELQELPNASTVRMLNYTSIPRHMDEVTLQGATELALDRTNIETHIVTTCPVEGSCLAFENGHLRQIR